MPSKQNILSKVLELELQVIELKKEIRKLKRSAKRSIPKPTDDPWQDWGYPSKSDFDRYAKRKRQEFEEMKVTCGREGKEL